MVTAIILAGGVGSRLGADRPKQFVEIAGKPVLAYTLEAFQNVEAVDNILVVCVKSHLAYMQEMAGRYGLSKVKWVTEGGSTFQGSVLNGVRFLEDKCGEGDTVLIHFGASPFVTADLIEDAIHICQEKGNAISTTPFFLLSGIKDPCGGSCSTWIDRDTIACMNSPHAFRYGLLQEIYRKGEETGAINEVEPHTTTLMCRLGYTIHFSKGCQRNIKITTKEDLELFAAWVAYQASTLTNKHSI